MSQKDLFFGCDTKTLSIDEAAKCLCVSSATIRNWIKTGYLTLVSRGRVSNDSVEMFKANTAGELKLNQRANKSKKDTHDHEQVMADILKKINTAVESFDILGSSYEEMLSNAYRNKEGIYYTPDHIVADLMQIDIGCYADKKFCDPCCGSGNFLMRALELGFKPENIFGFDTDPVAVAISRRRIFEKTGFSGETIICADFLEQSVSGRTVKYDFIFTNPPWGKKIDKAHKVLVGGLIKAGASLDTSSLFYFACLHTLNPNGKLGLLLPEAFFNVMSYEDARLSALSQKIERLCHYGKPFKGVLSAAVGLVIAKEPRVDNYPISCVFNKKEYVRNASSFRNNPKSIFNIACTSEEADVISYIYSLPHVTLKGGAAWALGIVTGNNEKFIEPQYREGLIPVYKGADISRSGIKQASCFIPADFSLYQQVAPLQMYTTSKKIIYRFISSNLRFFYDTDGRFVLNSANVLIVSDSFPVPMNVLCELFNSDFMNWVFSKLFDTHKILRGDLEMLPIHTHLFKSESFVEAEFLEKIGVERINNGTFRVKK